MGFLDDVLNKAVPQGSGIAKPLMLAFVALLASGALTRKQAPGASRSAPSVGRFPEARNRSNTRPARMGGNPIICIRRHAPAP